MAGAIVAALVVLSVFAFVASVFTLYAWYVGPHHFAAWRAALRSLPGEEEAVTGWVGRLRAFSTAMLARVPRPAAGAAGVTAAPAAADLLDRRPGLLQWYLDRGAPTRAPKPATHRSG
jgi:hypothetical protein